MKDGGFSTVASGPQVALAYTVFPARLCSVNILHQTWPAKGGRVDRFPDHQIIAMPPFTCTVWPVT